MSQLILSIRWNTEEVGSDASKEMGLLARARARLPSLSLNRLPAEDVVQVKGGSSYFRRSGLKVCVTP